jgi:peptidoglycan/xylan/chitin deacetylase (PgdA/CDA1 family)
VFTHALVPLARNRFYAIQFLVADLLGQSNEWEQHEGEVREPLMDAPQVREWLAAGHEIGSHTLTHPHLTQLPPGQAREEIFASKKKLEDLFGRPIRHFCYPYGDWNEVIRELVQEAGYETACTTGPGVNTAADSSFALKRFTARYPSRNLKAIWSRLSARRR